MRDIDLDIWTSYICRLVREILSHLTLRTMSKVETNGTSHDGEGEFIQVRKKSEKNPSIHDKTNADKKRNNKSRSRNNSIGEGKPVKPRYGMEMFPISGLSSGHNN